MLAQFGGACAQFLSVAQSHRADNVDYHRHWCSERKARTSPNSTEDDDSNAPDPTDDIAQVGRRPNSSHDCIDIGDRPTSYQVSGGLFHDA